MILQAILAAAFAIPMAECAKYWKAITGCEPAAGTVRFAVDPKVSMRGHDAYTIKSADGGVVLTGSNARSVLYALYDLLERRGGCHWFWDGDVVPKKASIDLAGLDVREEAHFEWRGIRYFAHRGLTRFQAEHWGLEDWKKEIDWCLKRRLNVFMLRIGQDDLFQRAFPETCAYPDPAKDLPGHGAGYDNRTLFWSLRYRGKLRQDVQRYAFDRGLEVPEDFGTMTHWYSRTPKDFLDKVDPPFLPQAAGGYRDRSGLVWDIRDDRWVDAYWKMTKTAVGAYGKPGPGFLHTIGLGERLCYTNRADNLKLKLLALDRFLKRAHRDYPEKKVLLAGWDFYYTWRPEEVRALVETLDPERDIIWDYEGDATSDFSNFTKWGVVGRFPYTYSIFLAYEDALDVRANYPLIEARQRIVQDDPMCKGFILWPESSHTDTLCLRYFTANAWSKSAVPVADVIEEFCASRYGADAAVWKPIWEKVVPLSRLLGWHGNYGRSIIRDDGYNAAEKWKAVRLQPELRCAPEVFRALAAIDWKASPFAERDAIDLARTTADRLIHSARDGILKSYHLWKDGKAAAAEVVRRAGILRGLGDAMADLLALHTDYSLAESYERLDAVERIVNPNFPGVLVENATCSYCASHQYEAAEYLYKPAIREFADDIVRRATTGDRSDLGPRPGFGEYTEAHMRAKPLGEMRPTLPRTQANYVRVLGELSVLAEQGVGE